MPNSENLPKIDLPDSDTIQEMRDAKKKKARNTSHTQRASKTCHWEGHQWRDLQTGGLLPRCRRCGKLHHRRGRIDL